MQLQDLAVTPQLKKITVDDPTIVEAYGEAVEFYMFDRQDLPTYLRLAQVKEDQLEMWNILKELILDSQGNRVLKGNATLPIEIMAPILEVAVKELGNPKPQTSRV